jgi:predicted N-acetyltransferase YhbS
MIVRQATLDDTHDVVAVHLTNPDRPFDRPPEGMTIDERCNYGGPWMAVETCAIHLNNLLAWGYLPLVVEEHGRVIAEAEYYVGPDIPPLGRALDISVLFVHSNHQRQGAGSLLMSEMIRGARQDGCDSVTVGNVGAPDFYRRFGFAPALELEVIDCEVPALAEPCTSRTLTPAGFDPFPEGTLWIGRVLSPTQKWREIVDAVWRRDALLPEHAGRPKPVGVASDRIGFVGFLVPQWGNAAKAEVYCWSQTVTEEVVSELLSQARAAGYSRAWLLCHPDVTEVVGRACDGRPSDSWPIWAMSIHDRPG